MVLAARLEYVSIAEREKQRVEVEKLRDQAQNAASERDSAKLHLANKEIELQAATNAKERLEKISAEQVTELMRRQAQIDSLTAQLEAS